jgi:hypothetical protein
MNDLLERIAKRADNNNPIKLGGEVMVMTSRTDMYANGQLFGLATSLDADFFVAMAAMEAKSKDIPTPWPGLSIGVGAKTSGLELKIKGSLKCDEQYQNPWIASSIGYSAGTEIEAFVSATIGPNFAGKASGLEITGGTKFIFKVDGSIIGKGRSIVTEGKGELGKSEVNCKIKAVLDVWGAEAEWQLWETTTILSAGNTEKFEEFVLYSW